MAFMSLVPAELGRQQPTRNEMLVHGSCIGGKQTMTSTFEVTG